MGIIGGADGPTSVFLSGGAQGLNLSGLVILALLLAPNLIWAARFAGGEERCKSRLLQTLEQIGRFGCMGLMVFPLGGRGFACFEALLAYLIGSALLLAAYWLCWLLWFKRQSPALSLALALLPVGLFLLCGVTLRCLPLALCALLFGAAHLCITWQNTHGDKRE